VDGEVTEDELDHMALAIERVLFKDVRLAAAAKRKEAREARRVAERETRRLAMITARAEKRAVQAAARARAGVLHQSDMAPFGGSTQPQYGVTADGERFLGLERVGQAFTFLLNALNKKSADASTPVR
jgi:hypothetical protein